MKRGLTPERVFWCNTCGLEGTDQLCPGPKFHVNRVRDDVGWRVGHHRGDFSYYSTLESAMRDRRVK